MKIITKYCRKCKKRTYHLVKSSQSIGERLLLDFFTFGFNDMSIVDIYECNECGETTYDS